jgi:hypothetical protein
MKPETAERVFEFLAVPGFMWIKVAAFLTGGQINIYSSEERMDKAEEEED